MKHKAPALFSCGPVVRVDVSCGKNHVPPGFREVDIYLETEDEETKGMVNLHLFITQEALEQLVRGLRAVKNTKEKAT